MGAIEGLDILDCELAASEARTVPFGQVGEKEHAGVVQLRFGYLQLPVRSLRTDFSAFKAQAQTPSPRVASAKTDSARDRLTAAAENAPARTVTAKQQAAATPPPATAGAAASATVKGAQAATEDAAIAFLQSSLTDATIAHNTFDGLTVPLLVLGQLGTVRLEDNTARACYGGFWLIGFEEAATTLVMLDRMQTTDQAMANALSESDLTALSDPVLLLATAVGRILPRTPPSDEPAGTVGTIELPDKELLASAMGEFARLYTPSAPASQGDEAEGKPAEGTVVAPPPAGGGGGGGPDPTDTATSAQTPTDVPATEEHPSAETAASPQAAAAAPPSVDARQLPPDLVAAFENPGFVDLADLAPEADPGTGLIARLTLSANQIDAVLAESDSGAGLLLLTLEATAASTLIAAANRVRSRVPEGATANVLLLHACTLTGNIISNELKASDSSYSLLVRAAPNEKTPAYAITGNVLIGHAVMPPRNQPAPFNVWAPLNTVVPYL